jgi:dihydroneopterin aldolase
MAKAIYEVNELVREADIGCAPDEHGLKQAVVLTLRATVDTAEVFTGDTYTPPYDYVDMVRAVDDALAARPRYVLQETLAVEVARRVLANPLIESLDVHLAKTERYAGCRHIGLHVTFDRAALAALAPRYGDAGAAPRPANPHTAQAGPASP